MDPSSLDPEALGLKCGLEIHQQLATSKLFCSCPSVLKEGAPDFEVTRRLRARAGESGDTDQAALHETRKRKRFRYQGYHDANCLVELDEEPPHAVDREALKVATQAALMLGASLLPKVQVMRKTVVDGSNTTGFQRTMLYAMGGEAAGEWGAARIQTFCLEEESAKIVERGPKEDVYNLSRLGIPLVEIATEPDLTSPEAVRDCAAYLGLVLRSTRSVRRGLGTIRQDVNISIEDGARVEVKGAQDLKMIPELVRKEMARQHGLSQLKGTKLSVGKPKEVTKEFKEAKGFLGKLIKKGARVVGVSLKGGGGVLGTELYPGYRVGTELAGYAKANGFGGIVHGDEDEKKYGVSFSGVKKALGAKKDDSWLVLVGDENDAKECLDHVLAPRVEQLAHGVPSEVRKAEADGGTTYLRPMPGAARMYPETDVPDVVLNADVEVPRLLTEQVKAFAKKHGLSEPVAREAIEEPLFEELVERYGNARLVADALVTYPKEIRKREGVELSSDALATALPSILEHLERIPQSAVYELLVDAAKGEEVDASRYEMVGDAEIEKAIAAAKEADPDAPVNALMGVVMKRLRGRADGKRVMELLRK